MKPTQARNFVLMAPVALLLLGGLLTVYATDAGPFNDDTQPLACQDLVNDEGVPDRKLDALKKECEVAKAAPAASVSQFATPTPIPGTPPPLVPCDQWNPSSDSGGCILYGIVESRQPPPGYERTLRVTNIWSGSSVTLYAGSQYDDQSQGMVLALENDIPGNEDGQFLGEYRTASKEGALRIVSAEGSLLSLVTATGTEYVFDADALLLKPK